MVEWLRKPRQGIRPGEPVCRLEIDGQLEDVPAKINEVGTLIWRYVDEGEEIPLSGRVGEFSTTGQYDDVPQSLNRATSQGSATSSAGRTSCDAVVLTLRYS